MGESDDEVEKFKASLIKDVPLSPSQLLSTLDFKRKIGQETTSDTDVKAALEALTAEVEEEVEEEVLSSDPENMKIYTYFVFLGRI